MNLQPGRTESVLDTLYWSYFDRHPMDSVEISRQFSSLADILGKLTLKEHDQVGDLTCALCTEHEKKGSWKVSAPEPPWYGN